MNLKNNKGYVGVDASIAVLILLIIIPTITGLIFNVNRTNNLIDRKTEAVSIAVNTIESAKGVAVAELTSEKVKGELEGIYTISDITETDVTSDKKVLTTTKDNNTYKIEVQIQDYANTTEGIAQAASTGKVKIVEVIVTYKEGKEQKNIELSTAIS